MKEVKNEYIDQIQLRSEEVQEILTKVPHWMIRWGSVLFLSLLCMLLGITWFVKYPDVIIAEAVITTQIPPQKEYAKITSKFDVILVKDNQDVQNDQPLAILENTANYKDVYLLKSILDTIKLKRDSFSFPLDRLPILFLGDVETQYALFENNYIQYQLNKQLQPFSNEAIANTFSISELKRQLRNLQSQKEINKTELDFKSKDLERNKLLFDKGVISAQDFENKQLEYAQTNRNYKTFESAISQLREGLSNANKTSKGTEINKVKEEMVLLKNVMQSFNQLKKAIKDWEYQYVFKSNINGKVVFLNYWNINQTVSQGDLIFTIIPNKNSSFVAKLKIPLQNSGKIKIGQRVHVKLDNYPEAEFGVLNGEIQTMSLIPDKEGKYLLNVKLPQKLITSYKKEIAFKQEMTGVAEIITEDLRLIDRIFYQFKEIFKR